MAQKILIVDDDADLRQILLSALDPLGEVSAAADGAEAVRQVKSRKPNLMLLDVAMPGMNGLEVLLAARVIQPTIVVVMLTGESDLATAKKALELGARTYITKPFDMEVVYGEVVRLLESISGKVRSDPYRPWRVAT